MNLLRYNGRHYFYWCLGGNRPMGWPKLNPISSAYGGGIRTISAYEPRWLFRLRQRLFSFAGKQRCGRRGEHANFDGKSQLGAPDTWDIGPDGNRTCSYCGSIHFDDLMNICRLALTDERYGIEGTDKSYKVYVRQPNVRNAGEGAIKYYKQHTPEKVSDEDQALFRAALDISDRRFREKHYPVDQW